MKKLLLLLIIPLLSFGQRFDVCAIEYYEDGKYILRKEVRCMHDGTKRFEFHYKMNEKHGPWKEWDADGNLIQEGELTNGTRTGLWKLYWPNGQIRRTWIHDGSGGKEDKKDVKYYDEQGRKIN